jgi:hypothetical protein
MKIKLKTRPAKPSTLGCWERLPDGSWQCGNVRIINLGSKTDRYKADWFVFLVKDGELQGPIMPAQRQHGYGHAGQAKIGASLMARYGREL